MKKNLFFSIITSGLSLFVQAQIPGGAIATYPFCGNANDVTGTNNGAVVGATLTANRFGTPNSAYYFNGGPNCYINLGTSSYLKRQEGSISVWARPDGFSNSGSGYLLNPIILTKNQPGNNCYEGYAIGLVTSQGPPQFHGTITNPFCQQINGAYSTVNYQNWYHIVLTWDYNAMKFYVNGTLVQGLAKGFNNSYLSSDSIMVGNSANVQNNRFFLGAIDDLIFYPKVLTTAEVNMLYNDTTLNCSTNSVYEQPLLSSLQLFPNPVTGGELFIGDLPQGHKGMIEIFNAEGQLLLRTEAKERIDVSSLAKGFYLLRYSDDKEVATGRFAVSW